MCEVKIRTLLYSLKQHCSSSKILRFVVSKVKFAVRALTFKFEARALPVKFEALALPVKFEVRTLPVKI